MRYEYKDPDFDGLKCDLDRHVSDPEPRPDLQALVLKAVLGLMIAALAIVAIRWLTTGDATPALAVWAICAPPLTLILRRFIGPFEGWK